MNELKEDIDWGYIIPKDGDTTVHIQILKGKFKDVTYQYGKVSFDESETGDVYLKFIYNIIDTPIEKSLLENDLDFKNHIGDILTAIISQNIDKGMNDETGTNYIEESD